MAQNVITDIESKTKASKNLSMENVLFIVGFFLVCYMLRPLVADVMQVPYYIFSILCGILLSFPSPYNKGRNNLQSLLLLIRADTYTYRPIAGGEENE